MVVEPFDNINGFLSRVKKGKLEPEVISNNEVVLPVLSVSQGFFLITTQLT